MSTNFFILFIFFLLSLFSSLSFHSSTAALVPDPPLILKYHNGHLLKGNVTVNLLWYGQFTPAQRSIIVDFILSLTSSQSQSTPPSVRSWWTTIHKYKAGANSTLLWLGSQILDQRYSLGKFLTDTDLFALASKLAGSSFNLTNAIHLVLTADNVSVTGFCSRCGTHSSVRTESTGAGGRLIHAWVGDSETQCPGQCAWPFHQPVYGPQTAPLVSPNGDVGVDGMVINVATVLAGTATNPFGTGYFQGPVTAPLEAVTACPGIFGSGAYPGYPGKVLVEKTTGASYNAHGVNGRKYLLPAVWDPTTYKCATLV